MQGALICSRNSKARALTGDSNHNPYVVFFFIGFMIIGSMFIINLFVGVVIDNFNKIKTTEELGGIFVTDQQRGWIEI